MAEYREKKVVAHGAANAEARERYQAEHGREARRRKAAERKAASDALTPKQKLAQLDERLGPGAGATRERKRLETKRG